MYPLLYIMYPLLYIMYPLLYIMYPLLYITYRLLYIMYHIVYIMYRILFKILSNTQANLHTQNHISWQTFQKKVVEMFITRSMCPILYC